MAPLRKYQYPKTTALNARKIRGYRAVHLHVQKKTSDAVVEGQQGSNKGNESVEMKADKTEKELSVPSESYEFQYKILSN